MARSITTDPLRNFKFRVEIAHVVPGPYNRGINDLGFMACSGLAVTTEPISYREGGDNTTPRKMPGQSDFPPVSLTRGIVGDAWGRSALWQWYREVFYINQGGAHGATGRGDFRCDVYIKVFDHPVTVGKADPGPKSALGSPLYGEVKAAWHLYNAWPLSLAFSDLDAGGNGVLVNNLTLAYEGFDFATDPAYIASGRF